MGLRYNFKIHARTRALERSSNFRRMKDLEEYDWKQVRNIDRFEEDADKLVYCEELELLGIIEKGLQVKTVISFSNSKMKLVNGKFEREERSKKNRNVSLRSEVHQEIDERRFERT